MRYAADSQLVISQEHMTAITIDEGIDATLLNAEPGVTWRDLRDALRDERSTSRQANRCHLLQDCSDSDDDGVVGLAPDATMEEFVLLLDDCTALYVVVIGAQIRCWSFVRAYG